MHAVFDDVLPREAWTAGMNPTLPSEELLDNPYSYTDYKSASTHGARHSDELGDEIG